MSYLHLKLGLYSLRDIDWCVFRRDEGSNSHVIQVSIATTLSIVVIAAVKCFQPPSTLSRYPWSKFKYEPGCVSEFNVVAIATVTRVLWSYWYWCVLILLRLWLDRNLLVLYILSSLSQQVSFRSHRPPSH